MIPLGVVILLVIGVGLAFAEASQRLVRWVWHRYGYCPTCDRLTTEEEL